MGKLFLEEIKNIFKEFDINCSSIKINNDKFITKEGKITRSIYFNISAKRDNLFRFMRNVGFEAEIEKKNILHELLSD